MNFEEAGRRYAELVRQWQSGRLRANDFQAAVAELRVQDGNGRCWQLDPSSGAWLMWNGSEWVKVASTAAASPAAAAGGQSSQRIAGAVVGGLTSARSGEMRVRQAMQAVQAPDQFALQVARGRLGRLSSRWWDVASILGGLGGGTLWLLYSSVRSSREGLDLFTPMLIALMPIVLVKFRGAIDQMLLPFQGIRQRLPRLILIGAGLVAPYLIAQFLYNQTLPIVGRMTQYPYMQTSTVLGTLASYFILRTPQKRGRN